MSGDGEKGGLGKGGDTGKGRGWDLDAYVKAHRTRRGGHNGFSDNSAHWPAMRVPIPDNALI